MTEAQILNLALTTVATMTVVLIGILINNARMSDSNARMSDIKEVLRAGIRVVEEQVGGLRDFVRAEMDKNHGEMLHRFGDLDTRLTRIENSLGINRN